MTGYAEIATKSGHKELGAHEKEGRGNSPLFYFVPEQQPWPGSEVKKSPEARHAVQLSLTKLYARCILQMLLGKQQKQKIKGEQSVIRSKDNSRRS